MHKIFRTDDFNASVHFAISLKPGGDKIILNIVFLDEYLTPVSEIITISRDISEFLTYDTANIATKQAILEAMSISDNILAAKVYRQKAEEIIKNIEL